MKILDFLYVLMIINGIALILSSVKLIKTVKTNRDKKVGDIESKLNKNLIAAASLSVTMAIITIISIIIR